MSTARPALLMVTAYVSWTLSVHAQAPLPYSPTHGDSDLDMFGRTVENIGDLDGDGVIELVIGAPQSDAGGPEAGAVYLYSGSDLSTRIGQILGHPGEEFGTSCAAVDDIDGDLVPDFVVGASMADGAGDTNQGRVALISGFTLTEIASFTVAEKGIHLGSTIVAVGDRDGDGLTDVLVGAPQADRYQKDAGAAFLLAVKAASFVELHRIDGDKENELLGDTLTQLPDIDGDSIPEFAVGSPSFDDTSNARAGRVQVFSGDSAQSYVLLNTLLGTSALEYFGSALDSIDDPDGGVDPCLLIGWRGKNNSTGGASAGGGGIYRAIDSTLIRFFEGDAPSQYLGSTATTLDDVDGDGIADVALGSFIDSSHGLINHGTVQVLSSRGAGTPGGPMTRLYSLDGMTDQQRFGYTITTLTDLDGDGYVDFAVGADQESDSIGSKVGSVHVLRTRQPLIRPNQPAYVDGDNLVVEGTSYSGRPTFLLVKLQLRYVPPSLGIGLHGFIFGFLPDSDGRYTFSSTLPDSSSTAYSLDFQSFTYDPAAAKTGKYLLSDTISVNVN